MVHGHCDARGRHAMQLKVKVAVADDKVQHAYAKPRSKACASHKRKLNSRLTCHV